MNLTSIKQSDVDSADPFPAVLARFIAWIGEGPFTLCSWGRYDRNQFERDCIRHGLDTAFLARHVNLKEQHGRIASLRRPAGLGRALGIERMDFAGTHHRGIDDARNIARIFARHIGRWELG